MLVPCQPIRVQTMGKIKKESTMPLGFKASQAGDESQPQKFIH